MRRCRQCRGTGRATMKRKTGSRNAYEETVNRIRQFLADERGAAMVMVAVALIMIFGFAVLSIDVGTMAVVKTQLQDGADAAALAGAQSYVQSGGDTALAITRAMEFAG